MNNNLGGVYNGSIEEIATDIIGGRAALSRFNHAEESGRIAAGRIHVESSLVLGGDRRANKVEYALGEAYKLANRQEELLERYAREHGCWLNEEDIISSSSQELPSGMESRVFLSADEEYVIKITNQSQRLWPDMFLDNRITLHNYLFPETHYELLGFLSKEPNKFTLRHFHFVLRQPFIHGRALSDRTSAETTVNNEWHLREYMAERFLMGTNGENTYFNNNYIVKDLHLHNVLSNQSGECFFIDTVPRLNVYGSDWGGKREYGNWEVFYY
jgi:hypothetical protein